MKSKIDNIVNFVTLEKRLIGLSLFRILTGLCIIYNCLIHYFQRHYLWGPNGVLSFELWVDANPLSLYALNSSTFYFEMIFHLGILITFLWVVGWKTYLMCFLSFVFRYSLYTRNSIIAHGGDNLSILVHLFLMFAITGAYFSIDKNKNQDITANNSSTSFFKQFRGLTSNFFTVLSILQICVLYTFAGLNKVSGSVWQSGTALYYILRIQEYGSRYSYLIYRNEYLVVIMAYLIICFQLGFALALVNKYTRYLWILGGIMFHLGIAIFMGLFTFSWLILATYPLLISDKEYKQLYSFSDKKCKAVLEYLYKKMNFTLPK